MAEDRIKLFTEDYWEHQSLLRKVETQLRKEFERRYPGVPNKTVLHLHDSSRVMFSMEVVEDRTS